MYRNGISSNFTTVLNFFIFFFLSNVYPCVLLSISIRITFYNVCFVVISDRVYGNVKRTLYARTHTHTRLYDIIYVLWRCENTIWYTCVHTHTIALWVSRRISLYLNNNNHNVISNGHIFIRGLQRAMWYGRGVVGTWHRCRGRQYAVWTAIEIRNNLSSHE